MRNMKSFNIFVIALVLSLAFPVVFIRNAVAEDPSLTGKWARLRVSDHELQTEYPYYITLSGNRFEAHLVQGVMGFPNFEGTIKGVTIEGVALIDWSSWPKDGGKLWRQPMTGTLSADGNTLTFRYDDIDRKHGETLTQFRGWETVREEWVLKRIQ